MESIVSRIVFLPPCKWGGLSYDKESVFGQQFSSLLLWGNGTEWGIFFFSLGLDPNSAVPGGPIRLQVTAAGAQAPRAGHASVLPAP